VELEISSMPHRGKRGKAQQGSTWTETPKGTVREGGEQREVRRMFKMLREV